ncbi:MAG: glycosyltransferase family 4 protein [Pseudomonadales bacterium]
MDLLIESLSRAGYNIDLLTFNEGDGRNHPNLTIYRVGNLLKFSNIRPGFSARKLVLDVVMFFHMVRLLAGKRYRVIHAVEESAFIAMVLGFVFRTPFIYDMDSSLATQMIDKYPSLSTIEKPLRWIESLPIRRACAVIPVCDALKNLALRYRSDDLYLLKDISLLDKSCSLGSTPAVDNLREIGDPSSDILLYIGNMEPYQGIDLLLESFALAVDGKADLKLIVIGGANDDVNKYKNLANNLGIAEKAYFLGPRPLEFLNAYCLQAKLLVSPRVYGENTPMKIYSYLDSGIPVLATRLPTHTEVMNDGNSFLAEPNSEAFAGAIVEVFADYDAALSRANVAAALIAQEHSKTAFSKRAMSIYKSLFGA